MRFNVLFNLAAIPSVPTWKLSVSKLARKPGAVIRKVCVVGPQSHGGHGCDREKKP